MSFKSLESSSSLELTCSVINPSMQALASFLLLKRSCSKARYLAFSFEICKVIWRRQKECHEHQCGKFKILDIFRQTNTVSYIHNISSTGLGPPALLVVPFLWLVRLIYKSLIWKRSGLRTCLPLVSYIYHALKKMAWFFWSTLLNHHTLYAGTIFDCNQCCSLLSVKHPHWSLHHLIV